jgi:hypothetical protein
MTDDGWWAHWFPLDWLRLTLTDGAIILNEKSRAKDLLNFQAVAFL